MINVLSSSTQDASNLLAVQNSEMLKRLAIVTSFALDNESTMGTAAVDNLSPLHMFIHEASNSLRWSMDFHKNYLFSKKLSYFNNTFPTAQSSFSHYQ